MVFSFTIVRYIPLNPSSKGEFNGRVPPLREDRGSYSSKLELLCNYYLNANQFQPMFPLATS